MCPARHLSLSRGGLHFNIDVPGNQSWAVRPNGRTMIVGGYGGLIVGVIAITTLQACEFTGGG